MKNFISGLVLGTLAGGLYGLLTTDRSGEEKKHQIKSYSEDVKRDAKRVQEDLSLLQAQVQNLTNVAIPASQEFVESIKGPSEELKKEAEMRTKRINDYVGEIESTLDQSPLNQNS